jgi:hypothetical protein
LLTLVAKRMTMARRVPFISVMITATEVGEMAQEVSNLPHGFGPAIWLEENRADLTVVATEAVKEVVYEALELGLANHPRTVQ